MTAPLFILGGKGALGFEVAFQLSVVPEGVSIVVQVRDPRDPKGRVHKLPVLIPTNSVLPSAEAKPTEPL